MNRQELVFDRPADRQAAGPPESRGLARDEVRLLVSGAGSHEHARFLDLPRFLAPGTVLVVNRSATLPASLPARGSAGAFLLNLSTRYGDGLWLAEPRWSRAQPGPLPLRAGESIRVGELTGRLIATYPGLPRLWFVRFEGDVQRAMARAGEPVRYGYLEPPLPPLAAYQTLFADTPGSAEMPSAARPFTRRVVERLRARGVRLVSIVLHTGVSSLEVEAERVEDQPMHAEPFRVPPATAAAIDSARRQGRRVVAVGTTVVRALESAWDGERIRPAGGFTRRFVHPGRPLGAVDGLLTGFHDPLASHLAMLHAVAGQGTVRDAYREAVREGYLWHEFGDSHLILPRLEPARRRRRSPKALRPAHRARPRADPVRPGDPGPVQPGPTTLDSRIRGSNPKEHSSQRVDNSPHHPAELLQE